MSKSLDVQYMSIFPLLFCSCSTLCLALPLSLSTHHLHLLWRHAYCICRIVFSLESRFLSAFASSHARVYFWVCARPDTCTSELTAADRCVCATLCPPSSGYEDKQRENRLSSDVLFHDVCGYDLSWITRFSTVLWKEKWQSGWRVYRAEQIRRPPNRTCAA